MSELVSELAIAAGGILCVFSLIFHDPPSGYNMGTGDSWLPFLFGAALILVGLLCP